MVIITTSCCDRHDMLCQYLFLMSQNSCPDDGWPRMLVTCHIKMEEVVTVKELESPGILAM